MGGAWKRIAGESSSIRRRRRRPRDNEPWNPSKNTGHQPNDAIGIDLALTRLSYLSKSFIVEVAQVNLLF